MLLETLHEKSVERHAPSFVHKTVFCILLRCIILRRLWEAVKIIVVLLTRVSFTHAQLTHLLAFFFFFFKEIKDPFSWLMVFVIPILIAL